MTRLTRVWAAAGCLLCGLLFLAGRSVSVEALRAPASASQNSGQPRPNSLCAASERILFTCVARGASAKLISLCGSQALDRERGYLQYRFGTPGRIELEYPNQRTGTQKQFHYTHYFRFQVDRTSISFNLKQYQYSLFSDYDGNVSPAVIESGVRVKARGREQDAAKILCREPTVKADFSAVEEALPASEENGDEESTGGG